MRLPRQKSTSFTGRKAPLEDIYSLFWPSDDQARGRKKITLFGLAGAGKSEAALQYAYTHSKKYDAIFWVQAQNTAELETGASLAVARIINYYTATWDNTSPLLYQRIASTLRMFGSSIEDHDGLMKEASRGRENIERLKDWLPRDRPWLLILDNYNDPKSCDINSLLPNTGVGHVLITSQNSDVSMTDEQVEIPSSLGRSESVDLLRKVAGKIAYCCKEEPGASLRPTQNITSEGLRSG
jgi:hypothetical protein